VPNYSFIPYSKQLAHLYEPELFSTFSFNFSLFPVCFFLLRLHTLFSSIYSFSFFRILSNFVFLFVCYFSTCLSLSLSLPPFLHLAPLLCLHLSLCPSVSLLSSCLHFIVFFHFSSLQSFSVWDFSYVLFCFGTVSKLLSTYFSITPSSNFFSPPLTCSNHRPIFPLTSIRPAVSYVYARTMFLNVGFQCDSLLAQSKYVQRNLVKL
jgi:hypothetical protein